MSRASKCPTCKGEARPHPENPAHPFCSSRCKLADLSDWFNERYAVPAEETHTSEGDPERETILN